MLLSSFLFSETSIPELIKILGSRGISEKSLKIIESQEIDGEVFLELTESDVEKMGLPLGAFKKLNRIIREVSPTLKENLPKENEGNKSPGWLKCEFCCSYFVHTRLSWFFF